MRSVPGVLGKTEVAIYNPGHRPGEYAALLFLVRGLVSAEGVVPPENRMPLFKRLGYLRVSPLASERSLYVVGEKVRKGFPIPRILNGISRRDEGMFTNRCGHYWAS